MLISSLYSIPKPKKAKPGFYSWCVRLVVVGGAMPAYQRVPMLPTIILRLATRECVSPLPSLASHSIHTHRETNRHGPFVSWFPVSVVRSFELHTQKQKIIISFSTMIKMWRMWIGNFCLNRNWIKLGAENLASTHTHSLEKKSVYFN